MTILIAELSGNHGGDLEKAKELIHAAKWAGCDAVKIQLYEPEDLCDPANNAIYEKCKVPRDWIPELFARAKSCGIPLFSSVFAPWAVTFLEQFDPFAYKIASPESTRLPDYNSIVRAIWTTDKEFFVSAGRDDMTWAYSLEADVVFYCKKGYPAKIKEADLHYMEVAKLGFSDHTADVISSLAMIKAGATHLERHLKLDDDCIDAAFSLNPSQMKLLCRLA
jgi:pseudaminic acid synthase